MADEPFDPNEPAGVFTSRWWGIVSTVYLFLGPLFMFGMILIGVMAAATDQDTNSIADFLFAILAPLVIGFLIATGIEFRRKAEPPLSPARKIRRFVRIGIGFSPFFFVAGALIWSFLLNVSRPAPRVSPTTTQVRP